MQKIPGSSNAGRNILKNNNLWSCSGGTHQVKYIKQFIFPVFIWRGIFIAGKPTKSDKDQALFDSWYVEFYPILFRYAMSQMRFDEDAASETVHKVFEAVYRKVKRLRRHPNPGGWFFNATRKEIKKYYRDRGSLPKFVSLAFAERFLTPQISYDPMLADNAVTDEEIQLIKQDIMNKYMKPDDREAFLMFHDENIRIAEIARRFSTTEGAMKTRLFRLRIMLKDHTKNIF